MNPCQVLQNLTNTVEIPSAFHSGDHHPEFRVSHLKPFFIFLLPVHVNPEHYRIFRVFNLKLHRIIFALR